MKWKVKVLKYEEEENGKLLTDCPYGQGWYDIGREAGFAKVGSAWCTSCEFCVRYDDDKKEVTCSHLEKVKD
jgi:hypothetical protein